MMRTTCNQDNCFWHVTNEKEPSKCIDKCQARTTKGSCEQHHEWNRTNLTTQIYDFDGTDSRCQWHQRPNALDESMDSKEGDCRPKDELCFDPCTNVGQVCGDNEQIGQCYQFKEGPHCIPYSLYKGDIGEYCGYNYTLDHNRVLSAKYGKSRKSNLYRR